MVFAFGFIVFETFWAKVPNKRRHSLRIRIYTPGVNCFTWGVVYHTSSMGSPAWDPFFKLSGLGHGFLTMLICILFLGVSVSRTYDTTSRGNDVDRKEKKRNTYRKKMTFRLRLTHRNDELITIATKEKSGFSLFILSFGRLTDGHGK